MEVEIKQKRNSLATFIKFIDFQTVYFSTSIDFHVNIVVMRKKKVSRRSFTQFAFCGVIKRLVFPHALMSIAWAVFKSAGGELTREAIGEVFFSANYSYTVVEYFLWPLNMHETVETNRRWEGGGAG